MALALGELDRTSLVSTMSVNRRFQRIIRDFGVSPAGDDIEWTEIMPVDGDVRRNWRIGYRVLRIADLELVKDAYALNLSNCTEVTDVSALGGVHTLNIWRCINVTDVSALGEVHYLELSYHTGVTGIGALRRVHTLKLS